jgi:hypothetical protein
MSAALLLHNGHVHKQRFSFVVIFPALSFSGIRLQLPNSPLLLNLDISQGRIYIPVTPDHLTMGWRLATWGRQDLEDTSEYVIYGPLGRATHELFNRSKRWKLIPSYLDRTSERIAAKVARVEAVLNSNTGLLDDETWFSRRPVGVGGFGVAALFEKVNNLAEVVDVSDHPHSKAFAEASR